MGRRIFCDGCGSTKDDTEANRSTFTTVEIKKVSSGSPTLKSFELCTVCTNQVQSLISRLALNGTPDDGPRK